MCPDLYQFKKSEDTCVRREGQNVLLIQLTDILLGGLTLKKHIAFCCDDNYLIPACVMLESLMKKNEDIQFVAHTFADDLSEESIEKLKNTLKDGGAELIVHVLPEHAKELIQDAPTL